MDQIAPPPHHIDGFRAVRQLTETMVAHLEAEDTVLQFAPHVSPVKWHLGHTAWFFDTFILKPFFEGYRPFHPRFHFLFNSYYEAAGPRQPRPERGMLSRPPLAQVMAYRQWVDDAILALLHRPPPQHEHEILRRLQLGLHHEQQHQELMVMDTKLNFFHQPLRPALLPPPLHPQPAGETTSMSWRSFEGGLQPIGHHGEGFAFDNETPRHRVFLEPFTLADRCITNLEWHAFIEDGGYTTASLWLSDGWDWVQANHVRAPRYWVPDGEGHFGEFTVQGVRSLSLNTPVVHISGFEAEAFARWAEARLPTEFEWEAAFDKAGEPGSFLEDGAWHPAPATPGRGLRQMLGGVWEWTRSSYLPYPRYRPLPGALGEYNGKFMNNQWVLRGGSCATPSGHIRSTYRNFFYPQQRWMFGGLRLARDE